jgi:hypothetical protein
MSAAWRSEREINALRIDYVLSFICRTFPGMESYRRSNGQGILHSHSQHAFSNLPSIVERLASRSVTGRGLGIEVHQHCGFRLHILWVYRRDVTHYKPIESCFERNFFTYAELQTFCSELASGRFEGLCDCVSEDVYKFYDEWKVGYCARDPKTASQKYLNASLATIREQQEYEGKHCRCPVSSTATLQWS